MKKATKTIIYSCCIILTMGMAAFNLGTQYSSLNKGYFLSVVTFIFLVSWIGMRLVNNYYNGSKNE